MAIVKTILVEGPSEQLRVVDFPEGQSRINIDVTPETVLEGIRNYFHSCWKAKVHALGWLFPDDLWPHPKEVDPLLILWVGELGSLPVTDSYDPQGTSGLSQIVNAVSHRRLRFLERAVRSRDCAPWQRPDWLLNMTDWVQTHFPGLQCLSQVRTSPNAAVLRIRSSGGTYFLKSQPDALAYESALLDVLNRHVPTACPRIIPLTPDANTHVTEGIPGLALNEAGGPHSWEAALQDVAKLQIECAQFLEELIVAGVPAYRIADTATGVQGLLEDCVILQNGLPNRLEREEIRELFAVLPKVARDFDALDCCDLPETLIHDDLNQSNVFHTTRGKTAIIDWALARISHPFFVLASAVFVPYSNFSSKPKPHDDLCAAYLEPWRDFDRGDRLQGALDASSRLFWIDAIIAVRLLCQDQYVDNRTHLTSFLRAILKAYRLHA